MISYTASFGLSAPANTCTAMLVSLQLFKHGFYPSCARKLGGLGPAFVSTDEDLGPAHLCHSSKNW